MLGKGGSGAGLSPAAAGGQGQCFVPDAAFEVLSPVFVSLRLAVHGLSHAKAFLFSPPRLHQAHKMCENVTFSLSACFRLGLFFFFSSCLFCRAREEALSLVFYIVCLIPWECHALSQSAQTAQTPLRLLRRDALENPVDVPKCAQGRGFWLPKPLALQCVQRDTGVWWIFIAHEGEAEFREAPSDVDAPGWTCPSGSVSAAPWWSLAMPVFFLPHQDLQLHLFHFLPFSSCSKTPVSCFSSGCLDLPRPREQGCW